MPGSWGCSRFCYPGGGLGRTDYADACCLENRLRHGPDAGYVNGLKDIPKPDEMFELGGAGLDYE